MNHTITTTLNHQVYTFLEQQAQTSKKTKKSIIEEALKLYQKYESELNNNYSEIDDEEWVWTFNKITWKKEKTFILW